jgi:hypothetical protein
LAADLESALVVDGVVRPDRGTRPSSFESLITRAAAFPLAASPTPSAPASPTEAPRQGMASVACRVELRCRGDVAAERLLSAEGLRCLPGLSPDPGVPPVSAEHEFDFPYLGPRRQATELRAEDTGHGDGRQVRITGRGGLVSYAVCWALGHGPRPLTFEYEVSDALLTEAVNALRAQSPLPFRSDADAILTLAVSQAFDAYFERVLAEYADAARALAEAPA